MSLKLPFGLKNGKLVEVDEVERGLNCGCVCPSCNSKLIARKGEKKIQHFAHYNNPDCEYGFETALHLAAKEIFQKYKRIKLPHLSEWIDDYGIYTLIEELELKVDNVFLENKIGQIIPDVVLEINGHKLLVEIAVTHFINDEKLSKIKEIGISTIEIDISDLKNEKINFELLKTIIIDETEKKYWIYNSRLDELILIKRKELDIEKEKKIEKERKKAVEAVKREDFYQNYKKEILIRKSKKHFKFNGNVWHVDNCALEKNVYFPGNGKRIFYANVHVNCFKCKYCRGLRDDNITIICLAEYYLKKNIKSK